MSTLVAEPVVVEEVKAEPFSIVADRQRETQSTSAPEARGELHPMLVVFVACVIAFHVAAAMIGTVTAWIYQLRHSGAFAP